jgi:hypothetical protein
MVLDNITTINVCSSTCLLLSLVIVKGKCSHGENDIRIKRERVCLIYCHLYFSELACGGLRTTAKALSFCGMVQAWLFSFLLGTNQHNNTGSCVISLDGLLKMRAADIFHDRGGDHIAAEDPLCCYSTQQFRCNKSFFMVDGMVLLVFY